MEPPSFPLPTQEQCYALTDEQCRMILQYRNPNKMMNSDWEEESQAELVRLYMTMKSFKSVEDAMKSRLDWCYKTYQNRYKEWRFPSDRFERERLVREMFAWITSQADYTPLRPANTIHTMLPSRPIQPHPATPPVQSPQAPTPPPQTQPVVIPADFFHLPANIRRELPKLRSESRASVSTVGTFASNSTSYTQFDDTFSSHRASIATTNSSLSSNSHYLQPFSSKLPKHDPVNGLWNDVLRVIGCRINHSGLLWNTPFNPCHLCGFSRWHSLMVHAPGVGSDNFRAAMTVLRDVPKVDFAGNHPVHFLLSTGVGMEYIACLFQSIDYFPRNVFGQNPAHVLNPSGLGDQLIDMLEFLKARQNPLGLLTQRDCYCRTPLHALLLFPLERHLYRKILDVFPIAEDQLLAIDTTGRQVVKMMHEASMKFEMESPIEFAKIQAGITEIKAYLSDAERTHLGQLSPVDGTANRGNMEGFASLPLHSGNPGTTGYIDGPHDKDQRTSPSTMLQRQDRSSHRYGFHDIFRGARGITYFGYFECRICKQSNAHTNSYLDQMICACRHLHDTNGPDETGRTPAHALVSLPRCNDDAERTPETPAQTAILFKFLIPQDDPKLLEALIALDPEGNSLVYNIAIRGFDEILDYVLLQLVDSNMRSSMVNAYANRPDGSRWSVLAAVIARIQETATALHNAKVLRNRARIASLVDQGKRLGRIRVLLRKLGAEVTPSPTKTWQISFTSYQTPSPGMIHQ